MQLKVTSVLSNSCWSARRRSSPPGNALAINPTTLQHDPVNGTIIYPRHVLSAFRRLAGIDDHAIVQPFQFFDNAEFDFFNADLMTAQGGDPRNTIRI